MDDPSRVHMIEAIQQLLRNMRQLHRKLSFSLQVYKLHGGLPLALTMHRPRLVFSAVPPAAGSSSVLAVGLGSADEGHKTPCFDDLRARVLFPQEPDEPREVDHGGLADEEQLVSESAAFLLQTREDHGVFGQHPPLPIDALGVAHG